MNANRIYKNSSSPFSETMTTTASANSKPAYDPFDSPWNGPNPVLTDVQQCIKDCLRLATFIGSPIAGHVVADQELNRLQKIIEASVQKELNAWKAIMGGEEQKHEGDTGFQGSVGKIA